MVKRIVIDEFHVTVLAPRGLKAVEYDTISQTVNTQGFRVQLRRAVRSVVRKFPALRAAHVTVTH